MIEARIAPFINKVFTITGTQYYYQDGTPHGGLDISTGENDIVYSMVNGRVINVTLNDPSYGNYLITQDMITGDSFLFAHLDSISVNTGDNINIGQPIGIEGTTGESTGIHLHIELQRLSPGQSWVYNIPFGNRPNVAEYMGLTNTQGLQAIYNGIPTIQRKKDNFKWVLYSRKIRRKSVIKTQIDKKRKRLYNKGGMI